jgi:hypothetical protein
VAILIMPEGNKWGKLSLVIWGAIAPIFKPGTMTPDDRFVLIVTLIYLSYFIPVLATPWIVDLLRGARPLLWTVRSLAWVYGLFILVFFGLRISDVGFVGWVFVLSSLLQIIGLGMIPKPRKPWE